MAKSDPEIDPVTKPPQPPTADDMTSSSPPPPPPWGTWDELLLAYAVNRYGTKNWDSISSELQKRTPDPTRVTPLHCQQKYSELNRRFNHKTRNDVVVMDDNNNTNTDADDVTIDDNNNNNNNNNIPWLEDLRKQRVLELQTQLQNYDLYISSLQLKVKKLTEESEKPADLDNGNEPEKQEKEEEKKAPAKFPAVSGEDETVSDRDNQSVNGSNGNVNVETEEKPENGKEPGRTGEEKGEPEEDEPVKSEPGQGERTGEKENVGMKENSDVQSSASKSKKDDRGGVDRVRRGSTVSKDEDPDDDDDDDDDDDQSSDSIPVRSLPLVDFLARLLKAGSALFDRPRLDRQEKQRYKSLIRQHIDYEILQARLKEGWYSDGNDKFFRDLLLLVNNNRVFFPKESPESTAAMDLRRLILKEMMSKRKLKTDSKLMDKQTSLKLANLPPKRASEPPDSLLHKPKLAGPIIVCRKRSSITAKAAASSSGVDKIKEQTDSKNSEKVNEETPKRSRDSFPSITKKKGKSVEKNPANETPDSKPDKKKKLTEAEEKKQSAAKFLNRMKRSNNEPLLNTLKSTPERGGSSENDAKGGGGEHKRSGGNKGGGGGGEGKKELASKKSSGGRQGKEQGSPAKRSVGRPPKRAAALSPMSGTLGKRNRESGDSETLVSSKQTKKRSKR